MIATQSRCGLRYASVSICAPGICTPTHQCAPPSPAHPAHHEIVLRCGNMCGGRSAVREQVTVLPCVVVTSELSRPSPPTPVRGVCRTPPSVARRAAFHYLCRRENNAGRAQRSRPARLAPMPRRLQTLAAPVVPANDGVPGAIAHPTPFGVIRVPPAAAAPAHDRTAAEGRRPSILPTGARGALAHQPPVNLVVADHADHPALVHQ